MKLLEIWGATTATGGYKMIHAFLSLLIMVAFVMLIFAFCFFVVFKNNKQETNNDFFKVGDPKNKIEILEVFTD